MSQLADKIKRLVKYNKRGNCYNLGDWYAGWKSWQLELTYSECGYDEGWAHIDISVFGWHNQIQLPFIKSKKFPYGDCEEPQWGLMIHNNTLWLHYGGYGNGKGGSRYKAWNLPWFSSDCIRHEIETKDPKTGKIKLTPYKTLNDMKTDDGHWMSLEENPLVNIHYSDFTDKYDGTILTAAYHIEEMEWRRKWFHWTKLGRTVSRTIDIKFSGEVGNQKGSWKGGTVGCSYRLNPDETPEECLKRMERERSFDR